MPAIHDGDIDEFDNCDELSNISEQLGGGGNPNL